MKKIGIYFADDHEIVLTGLKEIIYDFNAKSSDINFDIVGFSSTSDELLNNSTNVDVDIFIIDLGFKSTKGDITIINMILKKNKDAKIVVFSMRANINTIIGCYKSGVKGYVSKSSNTTELINAILTVSKGDDYFMPGILDKIGMMSIRNPLASLTEREAKIFLMLSQNINIKDVEKELGISEKTINNLITSKIKPVIGVSKKNFREVALKMGLIDDL